MKLTTMAIRNIKRNFSKYVMYFFSLSFSVFTAYSFLALMDNDYVNMAFTHDSRYRSMLLSFGIIILVFVLFFLINSNNSFIRARKKEISTYALFGMTNGKIGKLLFLETFIVGIATLVVGIGVGIFFSKLTAMILLDISLSAYTGPISFTIDLQSVLITVIVFLLIFAVMGLSGLRVINKFQLVDLFKANKVSEGKSKGSIILLILSLLLIATGYYLASQTNTMTVVNSTIPILLLVITGTYIFFWSGLPKVISIVKRNKSNYYRGVNLISTASFSHRIKSIGSVMATISILSAVATTAIATGFTLYSNIEKNTYEDVGYDLYYYGADEKIVAGVEAIFEKNNVKKVEAKTFQLYETSPKMDPLSISGMEYFSGNESFRVYSESEFNQLISKAREKVEPVKIQPREALYIYQYWGWDDIDGTLSGHLLSFEQVDIEITSTKRVNYVAFSNHLPTIVVSDADFETLMENGEVDATEKSHVYTYDNALRSSELDRDLRVFLNGNDTRFQTAYYYYSESLEVFGLVSFIGFFMSAVFILMTASLLYFKQVMAAEEEKHQYKMLRKIGMDHDIEKKIITKRLLPVFLIPLVIGIIHSIFAMKAADTVVFSQFIRSSNSYYTVLSFSAVMYGAYAIVYGVFYFITKAQYTKIVK